MRRNNNWHLQCKQTHVMPLNLKDLAKKMWVYRLYYCTVFYPSILKTIRIRKSYEIGRFEFQKDSFFSQVIYVWRFSKKKCYKMFLFEKDRGLIIKIWLQNNLSYNLYLGMPMLPRFCVSWSWNYWKDYSGNV